MIYLLPLYFSDAPNLNVRKSSYDSREKDAFCPMNSGHILTAVFWVTLQEQNED